MALSPWAAMVKSSLHQTCLVEPFAGCDSNGAATYGDAVEFPCRITQSQRRQGAEGGTVHGAWGTSLIFAADSTVSDKDRITVRSLPGRGPIIASVMTYYDEDGTVSHKEVSL